MRSVSSATCTEVDPVSLVSLPKRSTISRFRSAVRLIGREP